MRKVPLHKDNAIGIANDAMNLSADRLARRLIQAANAGEPEAVRFVDAVRAGPSTAFLTECAELLKDFRMIQTPTYRPRARQFHWVNFMDPPQLPGKDWAYALIVARLVNAGVADRLKQCAAEDCDRYFFGDPRSRWCSRTCGSRQRVRNLRGGKS